MAGVAVAYDMYDTDYSDAQLQPKHQQLKSLGAKERETSIPGLELRNDYVVPVMVLKNAAYRMILKRAIPVHLEGDNDHFIAIHEESRIMGEGSDAGSAVRDFYDAFIEIHRSYQVSDDELSGGGKDFREFLNSLIQTIETI